MKVKIATDASTQRFCTTSALPGERGDYSEDCQRGRTWQWSFPLKGPCGCAVTQQRGPSAASVEVSSSHQTMGKVEAPSELHGSTAQQGCAIVDASNVTPSTVAIAECIIGETAPHIGMAAVRTPEGFFM